MAEIFRTQGHSGVNEVGQGVYLYVGERYHLAGGSFMAIHMCLHPRCRACTQ